MTQTLFPLDQNTTVSGEIIFLNRRPAHMEVDIAWAAGRMETADGDIVTFVGDINVSIGDHIKFSGVWTDHAVFGRQLKVSFSVPALDLNGLGKVLERDERFKGIGPVRSAKIVAFLKARSLELGDVLRGGDSLINELKIDASLDSTAVESLRAFWIPLEEEMQTKAGLITIGVPTAVLERCWICYGSGAVSVITANPYAPVDDIRGYSIKLADEIALKKMGLSRTDDRRIRCGIMQSLDSIRLDGHTWITASALQNRTCETNKPRSPHSLTILDFKGRALVWESLMRLIADGYIATFMLDGIGQVLCPEDLLGAELCIMNYFSPRGKAAINEMFTRRTFSEGQLDAIVNKMAAHGAVVRTPSAEQRAAVEAFVKHKTSVITGAAGSGKTFTTSMIVMLCRELKINIKMCAPTGKAAKRMSEMLRQNGVSITGMTPPETIHMMLGYDGKSFNVNKIEADVILCDESSMLPVPLMAKIIKAMHPTTALILVGDHNQLPPVDAGAVLRDVVGGDLVTITRLGHVFRNAGPLRQNASDVLGGVLKRTTVNEAGFEPWVVNDRHMNRASAIDASVREYSTLLRELGEERMLDVQVLAGTKDFVEELNIKLKRATHDILHGFDEQPDDELTPVVGDRVMQTQNNYQLDVMNGEQGVIVEDSFTDVRGRTVSGWVLKIWRGDEPDYINIPQAATKFFVLGYAITTHKSQGSEWPHIIAVGHSDQGNLNRTLIYTMATRASKRVVFFGDARGLHGSTKNSVETWRRTLTAPKFVLENLPK